MASLLSVENLQVQFQTKKGVNTAVDGVSFSIEKGRILGIVGESGCGKSVTSMSILQLLGSNARISGGSIKLDGKELVGLPEKEMCKIRGNDIAMIFQDPMTALNPTLTIGNQLMEPIMLHQNCNKKEAWTRAVDVLKRVGIAAPEKRMKEYPHQLSGGMRQRVMIAMAVSCEPRLLIADEPTTALDVTIQAQILELMQELRKKLGMSIIMITHDLGVVASMCEKIAVMYAGHIVEYGTTDEIFYQPGHEYTKGLINSIPKLNTAEHERLVPIEGTPVDLLNPPAGCPFAPRCKNCMKICLSKMPPRTELSDTHYTYCWLQQKAAFEKGEKAE
mgnify:CR=1 FL=1